MLLRQHALLNNSSEAIDRCSVFSSWFLYSWETVAVQTTALLNLCELEEKN